MPRYGKWQTVNRKVYRRDWETCMFKKSQTLLIIATIFILTILSYSKTTQKPVRMVQSKACVNQALEYNKQVIGLQYNNVEKQIKGAKNAGYN